MIGRRLVPSAPLKGSKLSKQQVKSSEVWNDQAWTDSDLKKEEAAWPPSPGLSSPAPSLSELSLYWSEGTVSSRWHSGKKTFLLLSFGLNSPLIIFKAFREVSGYQSE